MKLQRSILFLISVFAAILMISVATDVYTPSLPEITRALNSTPTMAQFTLTFYIIAFCMSIYLCAPATDRWGRKVFILTAMLGAFVSSFLCIFAQNMTMVLFGRVGQGLCMGASLTAGNLTLRDVYTGHTFTRIRAFVQFATSAIMVFSPSLGGHLAHIFGWQSTFILMAALFAIIGLLSLFFIPETHKNFDASSTEAKIFFKRSLVLLKSPVFWGYTVLSGCAAGSLFAYLSISPFLVEDVLKWNARDYGYLAIIVAVAAAIGGVILAEVTHKIGVNKTLVIGVSLMLLGGALMLGLGLFTSLSIYTIMVPMFIQVIGATVVSVLPYSALLAYYKMVGGELIGVYGFMKYIFGAIISFVAALFHVKDQIPLGGMLVASALLAGVCFLIGDLCARKKA